MFGERLTSGTLWCICCCCCGCDICPSVQHKKAQRSNNYNHTMLLNVLHWQNVDIISIAECIAIHQCTGCKVTWHRQTSSRLPELMYVEVVHVTAPQTSKKLPVQISHTHIKQFVICGPTKCTVNAPYAYRTLCSVAYTEVQQVAWIVVIVVSHRQAPQFTTGIPAKTAVVSAWEVNHVPVCPMSDAINTASLWSHHQLPASWLGDCSRSHMEDIWCSPLPPWCHMTDTTNQAASVFRIVTVMAACISKRYNVVKIACEKW